MIHEFPRARKEGNAFSQRSPRQGTEITEGSPWFPLYYYSQTSFRATKISCHGRPKL